MTSHESQKSNADKPALGKSIGEIAHDLTLLAEMQAKLLAIDSRDSIGRLITPAVCMVLGVAALLGCLPVFLLAVATAIQDAGLSAVISLFIAAAIGFVLGSAFLLLGWLFIRNALYPFTRSATAFSDNIAWLRSVLKKK